jgi:hypothetical protein
VSRLVQEVVMRLGKTAVGVAGLLTCLIVGASIALGAVSAARPAGGRIQLFVQPAQANNANPTVDAATCSGAVSVSAPAPIIGGTGLYAGIHGTVKITESSGFIGSTYKSGPQKGRCNMSNSAPTVAEMAAVYGNGTVSF